MGKFKVGDKIRAHVGEKYYDGVVVETESGFLNTLNLCRLNGFYGHNGAGFTNRGRDYDTDDHYYLNDWDLDLISRKEEKDEKIVWEEIDMKIGKFTDIRIGSKIVVVPQEKSAPERVECKTVIATINGREYEAVCMPGDKFDLKEAFRVITIKYFF